MSSTAAAIAPQEVELVETFKNAMRRLAAGVTIVTAGRGDARRGLTATAVCSVSMEPPTILACVNRHGDALAAILASGTFCINLLSEADEPAALCFAGQGDRRGADKFEPFAWRELATGAPALDGALANIDCRICDTVETASHVVVFGTVEAVRIDPQRRALAYFDRRFLTL
jgi:flavin reductase (DIM6/NTAB) family NADH-FMN oxidoreductase RutF